MNICLKSVWAFENFQYIVYEVKMPHAPTLNELRSA